MAAVAADPVGRAEELATIAEFLEAGAPSCAVVIEGEPGIGKTTVWRAVSAAAAARGFRMLEARPAESETKLAFSSLTDLLDGALEAALPALPAPQQRALEAALLLEDAGAARPDRRAVAVGLLGVLRALAAEGPVLVAIDDIQWLDRSSAAALEFAVRRLGETPCALLLARRTGMGSERPALEQAVPQERVLRVTIGPLGFIELNAILHERLDVVLARPVLRRIHELSAGNPFFALELARASELTEPGRGLPPTLGALLRGRIATLPKQAQHGLLVAAAAFQPTVAVVERVVGVPEALAPAEAAGIVQLDHGGVRFEHPLLASAVYEAADPAQRREVHRRLSKLVRDPEERAAHLAAAATRPDKAVAAALEDAAARARARGAPTAAAELSEQAARLTPQAQDPDRRRRTADAGYYHFESGDSRRARTIFEELVARLPPGGERAAVLRRLAQVRSYGDDLKVATDLSFQAADEAGADRLTRAHALEQAASQLFRQRRRLAEAVDAAKTAGKLAQEAGDEALLAKALGSELLAEAALGSADAPATLEHALAYQPAAAAERILDQPKWTAAIVGMWWDDPVAARQAYEELVDRAGEAAEEGSLAYLYVLLSQAASLLGDFDRAVREAQAALEIAEQAGQEMLVAYGLAVRALAHAHQGLVDEARRTADEALDLGRRTQGTPALHFATAALGLLELSLGRPDEALGQLTPLVEFARSEQIHEPGLTRYAVDQIEALAEVGRLNEAAELLDWYEANASRLGRRSGLAASWRCRALLAAADGRLDESVTIFERALAEHASVPFPVDRLRTQMSYGIVLRRAKRKADARQTLEEAVAGFELLGARTFAERARGELARIGGRRPAAGGLTATERQIAELVAEGRSNKEVAAALFVTVKTVEANLSKVYAKLGIHSRGALARSLEGQEPAVKQ
jgi:DNA-binding CsgD family transcriptional regulator